MKYYDKQSKPITAFEWMNLCRDSYRIVKETQVGDHTVTTVWVGTDQRRDVHIQDPNSSPLIFRTTVMCKKRIDSMNVYKQNAPTERESLINHEFAVITFTDKGPLFAIAELDSDD